MDMKAQLLLNTLAEHIHQEKESIRANYVEHWTPLEAKLKRLIQVITRPKRKQKVKSQHRRQSFKNIQHNLS